MTTPPTTPLPANPTIPLAADLKAAYTDLYNQLETSIENTTDGAALTTLNATQINVDNILTKNAMYELEANTALYDALLKQINSTNGDLKTLKTQIEAISSGISTFGAVLAAINKVLTLLPAI